MKRAAKLTQPQLAYIARYAEHLPPDLRSAFAATVLAGMRSGPAHCAIEKGGPKTAPMHTYTISDILRGPNRARYLEAWAWGARLTTSTRRFSGAFKSDAFFGLVLP
jgi:hypothetical protein